MADPILDGLGANRVFGGQWYAPGAVAGHTLGKTVSLSAHMALTGNEQPRALSSLGSESIKVRSKSAVDMTEQVAVFNMTICEGENHTEAKTALYGGGYLARGLEVMQNEMDDLQVVFRLPRGTFEVVEPRHSGKFAKPIPVIHAQDSTPYLNPHLMSALMWITPENLMNGIVPIPPEVCAADPRLRLPAAPDAVCPWFALPPRHLLAMFLPRYEKWTDAPGTPHPIVFRVNGEIVTILVCQQELEALKWQLLSRWQTMVDRRPLGDIYFGASTMLAGVQANAELTVNISYLTWGAGLDAATIASLAPEVPPQVEQLIRE